MSALAAPRLVRRSRITLLLAMLVAGLIAVVETPDSVPVFARIPTIAA